MRTSGIPQQRDTPGSGDGDLVMLIGPARNGAPMEIGALGYGGDDPVVIHAMPLRQRFFRFLAQGGDPA